MWHFRPVWIKAVKADGLRFHILYAAGGIAWFACGRPNQFYLMHRLLVVLLALPVACSVMPCSVGLAADPFWGADPTWNLIHEPAVERELRLSPAKRQEFLSLLAEADATVFPLRNRPPQEAAAAVTETLAELAKKLKKLLSAAQFQRLVEIQTRQQGTMALLRPGLSSIMGYSQQQKDELEKVISETTAKTKELEKRAAIGELREPLEKQYAELKRDEFKAVTDSLSSTQKSMWRKSLGRDFDFTKVGYARFKPPELVDTGEWLNSSEPLTLESLIGKVVVLHFYAFGCINCVRNFPTYLEWQDRFRDKDVVIIGIHTPETVAEQDSASVQKKANENAFRFPVLIDREKSNWNAWGNSMWPSVYLIDKRGYLRHFWPGELKWQGAKGDKFMQKNIEAMLLESATP